MKRNQHTSWDDNDQQQNDDTDDQADTHLHILPPHLLANSVGTSAESLGGYSKLVGLIQKLADPFTTLRDLVDVVAHHTNGIVDLLRGVKSQPKLNTHIYMFDVEKTGAPS